MMPPSFYFDVCALSIIAFLTISFFSKNRVKNVETKIYAISLVFLLAGVLLNMLCTIVFVNYSEPNILMFVITKFVGVSYFGWLAVFTHYIFAIFNVPEWKSRILTGFNILSSVLIMLLPCTFVKYENIYRPQGLAHYATIILSVLLGLTMLVTWLKNRKFVIRKKLYPMYFLFIISSTGAISSQLYPRHFLLFYTFALVELIMYFTIENPDIKVMNELELAKNKAILAGQAKSVFLTNLIEEIRTPLNNIIGLSEKAIANSDQLSDELYETAKGVRNTAVTLLDMVENVIESDLYFDNNIEVNENEYSIRELVNITTYRQNKKLNRKAVILSYDVKPDVPKILIGDQYKLSEILTNLISNSIVFTDQGEIIVTVSNEIDERHNVSYLKISCKDTGIGISRKKQKNNV